MKFDLEIIVMDAQTGVVYNSVRVPGFVKKNDAIAFGRTESRAQEQSQQRIRNRKCVARYLVTQKPGEGFR